MLQLRAEIGKAFKEEFKIKILCLHHIKSLTGFKRKTEVSLMAWILKLVITYPEITITSTIKTYFSHQWVLPNCNNSKCLLKMKTETIKISPQCQSLIFKNKELNPQ